MDELQQAIDRYHKRREKRILEKSKKTLDKSGKSGIINKDSGNTRLPYGLCKAAGIDTTGMSPHEAWEALKEKTGIEPEEAYAELASGVPQGGKLVYNDPESVELYEQLARGDYLPMEELLKHPVVQRLDRISEGFLKKYGETADDKSPEREMLRRDIASRILETGAARVTTDEDGEKTVVYDKPLKKEFKACIVIGLPASGKSSRIVEPYSEKNGAFVLDSDRVKEEIPEFKETNGGAAGSVHSESRDILLKRIKPAFSEGGKLHGTNVVIPIVGSDYNDVMRYLKPLERSGYTVEVKYQDADPVASANRCVMRGIKDGRIIHSSVLASNGDGPRKTMEKIRGLEGGKYVKQR